MASNQTLHTFNSGFWTNGETGEHPSPFTTITSDDVKNGTWVPRGDIRQGGKGGPMIDDAIFAKGGDIPSNLYNEDGSVNILQFCIEYTSRLESKGRFQLCIWPKHCLIGTSGHNVVPEVMEAVLDWSHETGGIVEWVDKGQNLFTEMYSAFCAEVPLNGKTDFDQDLFSSVSYMILTPVEFVCLFVLEMPTYMLAITYTSPNIILQNTTIIYLFISAKERH